MILVWRPKSSVKVTYKLGRYNSLNLVTRIHVNFSQYSDCEKSKSWLDPISRNLNFTSWNLVPWKKMILLWRPKSSVKVTYKLGRYNSLNLVTRIHVNFSQYSDCQKSKSWLDPISKRLNFTSWNLVPWKMMILVWPPKSLMMVTYRLAQI
jgi:hypothetical protein